MKSNGKYKSFPVIDLSNRKWPGKTINVAPKWCSVDLRDGNQSLATPMNVLQKKEMFAHLVKIGFKEIEVGFPAASLTDFAFVRSLIDENLIPDDVTIQVLTQATEKLIKETIESLKGVKRVIIHLYNSTSPSQRRIVFGLEKPEIIDLAVQGTKWIKDYSAQLKGTEIIFQYSPESFSATEVEFALEVCEAVMDVWQPTPERKMIINLPATVEVAMPNVYADQIEWFCQNMTRRHCAIISVHTHNDRGTGVAATEFGILAGADRVEGTLFGNGERTGNVDLVTVALNLYTQGVDPQLDFSNLNSIVDMYEHTTGMTIHPRHPYSGELVFTAFSGSHQDAIKKGFDAHQENKVWDVPYLPIDPKDIGRKYRPIRVNGQSGKGGIGYLLEHECGIYLPKEMLKEFSSAAGKMIDKLGREVTSTDLKEMLWKEYVEKIEPFALDNFYSINDTVCNHFIATVIHKEKKYKLSGKGNGPIDAFVRTLDHDIGINICVLEQAEHSLGKGADASAIAYIKIQFSSGEIRWGVGVDTSISVASIRAVLSAINRR
jgi:2-isopropylmalate synthase